MNYCLAVSKRVKKLLKQKNNMTFYELADLSGMAQGSVDSIRYVTTNNITIKKIIQICIGLGISLKDFFDDPIFDLKNFIEQ